MAFQQYLWIGVAGTLFVFFVVGVYSKRSIKGQSLNFIVGGRRLPLLVIAGSLMTQALDANATLGSAGLAEQFGFWAGASLPVGLGASLLIIGRFFARPMNEREYLTFVDFYRQRYGRTAEVMASGIIILTFSLLLAGNLVAAGFLLEIFLGVDFMGAVVIVAGIIALYIIAGGLFAVTYTDVLQVGVMSIGAFAMLGFVIATYGVPVPAGDRGLGLVQLTRTADGALINWATIIALAFGNIVAVDFMERILSADNPSVAKKGCYVGGIGTILVGVPFSLVAVAIPEIFAARSIVPGTTPNLYVFLQSVTPLVIGIPVTIAIFAAAISTGDGAILGASTVISRNVLGKRASKPDSKYAMFGGDALLSATRWVAPLIAILGVVFALKLPAPGTLLVLAFDVSLAGLVVPFILGLYLDRPTQVTAIVSILVGASARLVFFVLFPTIFGVENTLLYVENSLFSPSLDGLPTIASPLLALLAYVGTMQLSTFLKNK